MSDPSIKHDDYQERLDVVSEHALAASREKPDPGHGTEPVSLWAFLLAGISLVIGGGYLGATNGGFKMDQYTIREDYAPKPPPSDVGDGEAPVDWIVAWERDGKKQFGVCAACHQPNGQGMASQNYPPLAESEWAVGGTERIARIVLNGLQGPIEVKGKMYNNIMASQGALTDKQIAQVMTYVRRNFGNASLLPEGDQGIVTEEMVAYARKTFKQPGPETAADLAGNSTNLPGAEVDPVTGEPIGDEAAVPASDESAAAEGEPVAAEASVE